MEKLKSGRLSNDEVDEVESRLWRNSTFWNSFKSEHANVKGVDQEKLELGNGSFLSSTLLR